MTIPRAPHRATVITVLALALAAATAGCGSSDSGKTKSTSASDAAKTVTQAEDGTIKLGKGKPTISVTGGTSTASTTAAAPSTTIPANHLVTPFVGIAGVRLGMTRAQVEQAWGTAPNERTQSTETGNTTRLNYGARSVLLVTDDNHVTLVDSTDRRDTVKGTTIHTGSTLASVRAAFPQADCADATPGPGVCRLDDGNGDIIDFIMSGGKVSRISIGEFRD